MFMQEYLLYERVRYMKQIFKRIINNDYSLSIICKILTAFIGIVSSAFSTRYLGIQYKGDYAYITHVTSIVVLILNLGIYQSYSYNYKTIGKGILKKYTDIFFCQFFIFILIMTVLLVIIKDPLICFIILLVPFNVLKMQYMNIGLIENIRLSLWLNVLNGMLMAICYMALFFWASANILFVVLLTVFVDIITILIYGIKLGEVPKIWEIDIPFFKSVIRFGFIPMLSGLLATINYSIDIIFLKQMGQPDELSLYSLAANIVNYVWLIPDAFKSVLFSKSAKTFDVESIEFSSQISIAFISICFIGFAIVGKPLLTMLYGIDFIGSYWPTLLLIAGAFSMSIYKIIGIVLVSQGKRIAHFVSLTISAITNVGMNALLIPKIGMYGAGIASVCSYSICGIGLMVYFCRLFSVAPKKLLLPSINKIAKSRIRKKV